MRFLIGILILAFCVGLGISGSFAETEPSDSVSAPKESPKEPSDSFGAEGERWTVKPGPLDSSDSKDAGQDLTVTSESGKTGKAEPAWVGENPLDVGRLWVIEDENGKVIAECQRLSSGDDIQCMDTQGPAQSMYAE